MFLLILVCLISTIILFYSFERQCSRRIRNLLSGVPGPKRYPLIGSALEFGTSSVDFFYNLNRIADEYGPVVQVWLGPTVYVALTTAKDIETVLSSTVHLNKPQIYQFLENWLGEGLISAPASKWKIHRKLLTPAFHFKILETYIDIFNGNARIMSNLLEKEVNKDSFNITDYVDKCTLDIICETAMSTSIQAQLNEESQFTKALKVVSKAILMRAYRPWLFPNFIFNLSSIGRMYNKNLEYINDYVDKVIMQKKKAIEEEKEDSKTEKELISEEEYFGTKKRLVFLDLVLQYTDSSSVHLTDKEIRDEVNTFMFAGHDTTASTISFLIYLLSSHLDVQEKVVNEMLSVIGDSDKDPTYHELVSLKYTEQVIKETLRLYPAVPFIGRYLSEDLTLPSGFTMPAGTALVLLIYKMQRDPEVFPEPDKFNPDNFLPERMVGRFAFAHTPFSAGPRNCIGQRFAMLEMKAVLSRLLRTYKFTAALPEPLLASELILRSETGINVHIEPRN